MKKALLTGSETFGKYITHPSKWLALSVDGKVIAGHEIYSLVFPSVVLVPEGTEDPGETIVRKAQEIDADLIISFGMFSQVKGFRLERSGSNWIHDEKCLPSENNRPLNPSRPVKEVIQGDFSYWNIEKMKDLFDKAGIPFESEISDNADYYSCNAWIYRTLLALKKKRLHIPYLFVHHACTEEAIALTPDFDRATKLLIKKEDMLQALEIILQSYRS